LGKAYNYAITVGFRHNERLEGKLAPVFFPQISTF
jgi:hypothetical protein